MNEVQRRREHVIARREDRWTFARIGLELGISGTQVQRLYKAGLADREKRTAQAAQDAATLDTRVDEAGLHPDVAHALLRLGLRTLAPIIDMDRQEFLRSVLGYHNVTRRTLGPLINVLDRLRGE